MIRHIIEYDTGKELTLFGNSVKEGEFVYSEADIITKSKCNKYFLAYDCQYSKENIDFIQNISINFVKSPKAIHENLVELALTTDANSKLITNFVDFNELEMRSYSWGWFYDIEDETAENLKCAINNAIETFNRWVESGGNEIKYYNLEFVDENGEIQRTNYPKYFKITYDSGSSDDIFTVENLIQHLCDEFSSENKGYGYYSDTLEYANKGESSSIKELENIKIFKDTLNTGIKTLDERDKFYEFTLNLAYSFYTRDCINTYIKKVKN